MEEFLESDEFAIFIFGCFIGALLCVVTLIIIDVLSEPTKSKINMEDWYCSEQSIIREDGKPINFAGIYIPNIAKQTCTELKRR